MDTNNIDVLNVEFVENEKLEMVPKFQRNRSLAGLALILAADQGLKLKVIYWPEETLEESKSNDLGNGT